MAAPGMLIECYHTVQIGGVKLLEPWTEGMRAVTYFVDGAEPALGRSTAMDTPDTAGASHGELYARGNTRWSARVERWVYFGCNTYPAAVFNPEGSPFVYNSPQDEAQQWLFRHLRQLPDGTAGFTWNGTGLASAVVSAEGRTEGPFAVVSYSITASEA